MRFPGSPYGVLFRRSTAFSRSNLPPVTLDDPRVLVEAAGDSLGIIYKGDIDNAGQARELLDAGVSRVCTSTARALLGSYPGFPGQS